MAFVDLTSELTGLLPGLSPLLAETYINRALREIYNARTWSFLLTDGVVVVPAQVTAGTAAIVQYQPTVTLDATASAAILPQTVPGAVPGLLQLQFRVDGVPPAATEIYSIVDFDSTNPAAIILTLDRMLVEATNAASQYRIYRCYIVPPIADFLRWESFVDPANAITLSKGRLTATSADFDRMDPQRTASGLSYWLGAWGGNRVSNPTTGATVPNATVLAGSPIYELWPQPTTGQTWYVRMRRRGEPLVAPTDTQPDLIDDTLIIDRALYKHAYPFAAANVANFPSFKNANWATLILTARQNYSQSLLDAKRLDNERQLQDVMSRGHGLRPIRPFGRYDVPGYPIDANFLQAHLIRF